MPKPVSWANYVPARDSRHRYACLTLYRHLLALANRVPLPVDLPPHPSGPRNPLAHQVRKAFQRNQAINSSRLVSAAFRNGYKGLAILKEAADPSSRRHAEVVDFIRARLAEANRSRAAHPYTPEERRQMKANVGPKRPILVRVPGPPPLPESSKFMDPVEAAILVRKEIPNLGYHYERAAPPVPKEQLGGSGRRHVPQLVMANIHAPFLRYKKPQPRILSHVLLDKTNRYHELGVFGDIIREEDLQAAQCEDEWDSMVGDGPPGSSGRASYTMRQWREFDKELGQWIEVESFSRTARISLQYNNEKVTRLKGDFILRTLAYAKIVAEERELAEKEKQERREEKTRKRLESKAAVESSDPFKGIESAIIEKP